MNDIVGIKFLQVRVKCWNTPFYLYERPGVKLKLRHRMIKQSQWMIKPRREMIKPRHRFNFFDAVKFLLIILATFGVLPFTIQAQTDTLRLSLDDCIAMARRQSIDAAVALGELRSAYWQWRSYRADLLPEVSLQGTAPSWNKRYSSYQQADGSLSFVRNDYLGLDGAVNITQKLWPTGGTLSVESSLDYLHQSGSGGSQNQFMSLPVAVTLHQPLFAVNHLKWNRRIEPLRYREAQARFLTETEQVAMQAISLYFSLLLAGEQVNIARQNLQTAEKLYEVAQAKRRMGTISENDVLQLRLDVLTARSALTNAVSTRQARQFALRSFLDVETDIEPLAPGDVPQVHLEFDNVLSHALQNNALATTMRRRQMEEHQPLRPTRLYRHGREHERRLPQPAGQRGGAGGHHRAAARLGQA